MRNSLRRPVLAETYPLGQLGKQIAYARGIGVIPPWGQ